MKANFLYYILFLTVNGTDPQQDCAQAERLIHCDGDNDAMNLLEFCWRTMSIHIVH